ncbi:MAG: hypothetical protein JSV88_10645 [Candidatus Aminicenantes bacterium]|nr:MAG: hypothetical protein JSV88_10645 [Candidatus Aminicenantes bacterium]
MNNNLFCSGFAAVRSGILFVPKFPRLLSYFPKDPPKRAIKAKKLRYTIIFLKEENKQNNQNLYQ